MGSGSQVRSQPADTPQLGLPIPSTILGLQVSKIRCHTDDADEWHGIVTETPLDTQATQKSSRATNSQKQPSQKQRPSQQDCNSKTLSQYATNYLGMTPESNAEDESQPQLTYRGQKYDCKPKKTTKAKELDCCFYNAFKPYAKSTTTGDETSILTFQTQDSEITCNWNYQPN